MSATSISRRTWEDMLAALREQQPELNRAWFTGLEPVDMRHGVIRVATTRPDHYQYLIRECQQAFNQAAQAVTERLVTVHFMPPRTAEEPTTPLSFEEETEQLVLNGDYTFEHFVTGPCNRLAQAASVAVSENPGKVYNPLYIHGDVGLGKTHLLQAACHQVKQENPDAKMLYISCETFTNHFVEAIERGALHQFRYRYRHVDMLVIDDIQFLAAREHSREEFFHTFNTLFQSQKQIILSGDESPRDIPSLEDRLISRFNWGLVARIDPPCLETRMAILRKKAKFRCIELPEDVAHFIAAGIESNTRELEGALTRVLALSQQFGGVIDLEIARQALDGELSTDKKRISISDVLHLVTKQYNVRLADLQGKRRHRSLAFPRQVCMYLARELTNLSLEEIGGYFGGRDHTTVLHAVRTIRDQRSQDTDLARSLRQMTENLRKQAV
jgi:chromosomal replication initiator protein